MAGRKPKAISSRASDNKLAVKKREKKVKAAKDPNKPKRPPSAFFVFMERFRKEFKEKNPSNKSVAAVGKAGGERWKSMSDSDKSPYVAKAEKLKAEYDKKIVPITRERRFRGVCGLLKEAFEFAFAGGVATSSAWQQLLMVCRFF